MKEDQQVFGEFGARSEVDLPEPLGDLFEAGRVEARPGQDDAQGVDVTTAGNTAQQRGFKHGGAPPHERVIDNFAGLGQSLDEETGQLRLKAGAIGNLVERTGLPLPGGPELVDERGDLASAPVRTRKRGDEPAGGLAKLMEGG